MRRRRFRHQSTKWSVPGRRFALCVEDADQADGVVVVSGTELADAVRHDADAIRRHLPDGWRLLQRRDPWWMAGLAVAYDARELRLVAWEARQTGPDLGPGLPSVGAVAVFDDRRTGIRYLYAVTHLPSAVEGSWFRRGRRVVAYQSALVQFRRMVRQYRRQTDPDQDMVVADWNLSLFLKWVRAYLQDAWPAFKVLVAKGGGTHGKHRQIDGFLVRTGSRIRQALTAFTRRTRRTLRPSSRTLPAVPGYDHRGVEVQVPAPSLPRRRA